MSLTWVVVVVVIVGVGIIHAINSLEQRVRNATEFLEDLTLLKDIHARLADLAGLEEDVRLIRRTVYGRKAAAWSAFEEEPSVSETTEAISS
jgi:hypothetical protein